MKQVNSLKFWHGLLFMLMMVSFTACVDDNEDTEAPFLEVNPATLTFENGGVQTLEISTNRQWKATVEDADWISLSKTQGEGSDQIQVSVPEGTIGEAKINIIMSNRSGILKSATVNVKTGAVIESKLIYNETLGNADASQKPYISDYQGWNKSGDGATSVEYAGNKTSIRSSGLTNTDAYEGASGPNVVFFGTAPATFDINKIALAEGQTNLKLTFGASRSKQNEDKSYDNSFTPEAFKVSVSSNGTTWQEITYEKNNGDADHPYWILATANFTLKKAVPELYIRFTASESSVFRLDDISLSTGYGGQEVNLEEGTTTPPEEGSGTAINKIINLQKGGQTKLTENMEFEAIVCGDPKVNNASAGTLNLMTPNATAANEGIVLYNGALNEQIQTNFSLGDKVKVSLKADKVKLGNYNGITQITDWEISDVAVVSKNNAVVPIQTTTDKLAEYAGMPATISNVTISEAGVWDVKTYNFGDLTVHFNKNATSIVGQPYKAGTGSITGIVTIYKENAQLMPRNLEDLKDFVSNEPAITSVDPKTITFTDKGGNQDVKVTLANAEGKSLTVSGLSGILSATVNGTTVTVTANPNTTEAAVKQTLTIKIEGTEQSVEVPVTVTPKTAEGNIIVMSSSDIINGKTGTVELPTSAYGKQDVQNESTWYNWTHNSINFKGAKICIATDSNGGGIQFQGNASDSKKQGFIFNTTKIEQIQYLEIILKVVSTSSYAPAYHVYAGTSENPTTNAIEANSSMKEENGFKVYTQTFDFTGGNYEYFTIKNDETGAIYISSIKITKK